MKDSDKVIEAFIQYEKTEDKSLVLHFTMDEIEKALIKFSSPRDQERPYHKALELRLHELREKRNDRILVFIIGAITASIPWILERLFKN